jgi:hypothetical protein
MPFKRPPDSLGRPLIPADGEVAVLTDKDACEGIACDAVQEAAPIHSGGR